MKETTPSDKSETTGRADVRKSSTAKPTEGTGQHAEGAGDPAERTDTPTERTDAPTERTDTPAERTGEPTKEFVAVKTHPPSAGAPAETRDTATQDDQGTTAGREEKTSPSGKRGEEENESGSRTEAAPISNGRENQVVHTRSVSIKGVLKGQPRTIPLADEEISEDDQVDKAVPPEPDRVEVTEDLIRKAWKEYAASIEKSHPRIYTTLIQQEPRLTEKGIIRISLTTQAQRENFIQRIKPELTRYFQKTIADVAYVFETDLIENETTVKKVYTDQDKLDYLINKNPDLEKMKSRFNLDFDD